MYSLGEPDVAATNATLGCKTSQLYGNKAI